jgi:blocked-early-in-transport protein 1
MFFLELGIISCHLVLIMFQGGDFESSQSLLGGSMHRMSHMIGAASTNRRLMCYIIIGLVILFFITYYIISRISG